MSKKKDRRSPESRPARSARESLEPRAAPTDRERGAAAFGRSDYTAAISAWERAHHADESGVVARALAEAHFRRAQATLGGASAATFDDLRAAADLAPTDAPYVYHLGLAYHRRGDRVRAVEGYREALRRDPGFGRAAYLLCLALVETNVDPTHDPAWTLLAPAQRDRLAPTNNALIEVGAQIGGGQLDAAEKTLTRSLSQAPRTAHYYLGVIAARRASLDEALAHWLAARASGFDTPALRQNLAGVYVRQAVAAADSPAAAEIARAALKFAPDQALLLTLRARAQFVAGNRCAEAGDWAGALTQWRGAIGHGKPSRELMMNLALAFERTEYWADAAETWREVVRKRPRRGESAWPLQQIAQVWGHIDSLYARAGALAKSTAALTYAIKAQPDDLTLRLALVKRQMDNQNWRGAESAVVRFLELAPGNAEALALYAQIVDAGGDLDRMIDAWERVLAASDSRQAHTARSRLIRLYGERGDLYGSLEDVESAAKEYDRALALAPDDPPLHARYGALLFKSDPVRAEAHFAAVDLTNGDAAFTVLSALHHAGQHAAALHWLEKIERTKPLDGTLLVELGADVYVRAPKIATTYFARAVESAPAPERPGLLTLIGVVYAKFEQKSEATAQMQQALALDANYGPAHLNLGLWEATRGRRRESKDHLDRARTWAKKIRRPDIADGIEEAIDLIEARYIPTLLEVLDTIDPDANDAAMRRLLGSIPDPFV